MLRFCLFVAMLIYSALGMSHYNSPNSIKLVPKARSPPPEFKKAAMQRIKDIKNVRHKFKIPEDGKEKIFLAAVPHGSKYRAFS